jgi:CheY-like chemotaxis protein
MKLSFIIIDDMEIDCYITEKIVRETGLNLDIHTFLEATNGLNFIKKTSSNNATSVILLDIMMPVMNGFQFMEEFVTLPEDIKKNYRIIAITTSLNKSEITKISNYEEVITILKKPYNFS